MSLTKLKKGVKKFHNFAKKHQNDYSHKESDPYSRTPLPYERKGFAPGVQNQMKIL